MNEVHVAVRLETKDDRIPAIAHVRTHIGTCYFPEGTTANAVCKHIMERQQTKTGLWLLQMAENHSRIDRIDDSAYTTVKDSKHQLLDGNKYVAVYYNGPPVFLDN